MLEAGTAIVVGGCPAPRALLPEAAAQAAGREWHFRLESGASRALVANAEMTLDRSFADLDAADWRTIREAAARILVPASERSRSRGAGAEVDDNE